MKWSFSGGSGLYADAVLYGLDEFPEVDPAIRPQLTAIYQQEGIEVLQDLLREHDLRHYQIVDKQNPHRLIRALEVTLSSGKPYSSFLVKNSVPTFLNLKLWSLIGNVRTCINASTPVSTKWSLQA